MNYYILPFFLVFFVIFSASAQNKNDGDAVSKVLYLTGNTGFKENENTQKVFKQIVKASQNDKNASLILMGNVTPNGGFPKEKNQKQRKKVEDYLTENLLNPLKDFNGQLILNPGKNEWNDEAEKNIDDLESFLQDNANDLEFWPNNGCGIEHESLSDDVELIMVDSQWFLEDWDKQPYINHKCDFKTREEFFAEFKDKIKDAQGKTVIVEVFHPIMSKTKQGFFGQMGGFTPQSYYNTTMDDLRGRLETIASEFEDVIFVSGRDRNMQFLEDDGIPQIISGTATKNKEKVKRNKKDDDFFTSVKTGYAKLTVYKNGSSKVDFFGITSTGAEKIYSKAIKRERAKADAFEYHNKTDFNATYKASIYTEKETDKNGFYSWFWGKHYRDVYGRKVEVPVLFIDTLPGNPQAISEGGGHQSRSLRIKDDNDHEYTLREIKKSATRFVQSKIKEHYVKDYMKNTVVDRIVQDFYTTAQPYAQYALGDLMDDIDIYHSNLKLYYLPKQKNLNIFNEDYGDKLYMLEEHAGDENKDMKIFGKPNDILSAADMLLEMRKKGVQVDEPTFIRVRLFDMLIGDWDRHEDQWRFAEFIQPDSSKVYKAIPRDRDQAFPKYDGIAIELLKLASVDFRALQSYKGPNIRNLKWLNLAGYTLDKAFINKAHWEDWKAQAERIQQELSDEKIASAFASLPQDTQDASIKNIIQKLKLRRDNLVNIAKDYYHYFKKFETLIGTEDDDHFLITRKPKGLTQIQISDKEGKNLFDNTYDIKNTRQIWIYGLDGDDEFKIVGDGDSYINLKIMGGEEHDIYDFENTHNAKLYDYKSKKNTVKNSGSHKWLVDSYEINTYDPKKRVLNENTILPAIAFDPDAGFQAGVADTYTHYGLSRNPFTSKHTVTAKYFSATQGYSLEYYGEFANIFHNWNFGIDALYTSPNYNINYFGSGNETAYDDDAVSMDYNRVGIKQWHIAPSLIWNNKIGYSFYIKPSIESYEVDYEAGEVTGQFFGGENAVFDNQLYAGGEIGFQYKNKANAIAFIRRGMQFDLTAGYKTNIDDNNNKFGYVQPSVSFDYPLHESGIAVLATKLSGRALIGNTYEFYHGSTVGGNTSLRGFRNERFNGKYSFYPKYRFARRCHPIQD